MELVKATRKDMRGETALYAVVDTPFGPAMLATWGQDICWLNFTRDHENPMVKLSAYWREGELKPASDGHRNLATMLFNGSHQPRFRMVGTAFQHQVWDALSQMQAGETISYGALAARIGRPGSARPVGGAVGANPIVYFVPCHRILASDGSLHGFGCGLPMKERLLAAETVKAAA